MDELNNIPISDAVPAESQDLGPATPQNQEETDAAIIDAQQAQNEQLDKERQARASLKNATPLALGREHSDVEVLDEMDRLDLERERQAQADQLENQQEAELLQAKVEDRKNTLARAAQRGMTLERDEELDPLIEKQAQEAEVYEQQIALQDELTQQKIAAAQTPDEAEIELAAAPIREQNANIEAERREANATAIKERQIEERKVSRLQEIDNKIKEINQMQVDPDRYWNKKSTGQKILASLAMALGGYAAGLQGGKNSVIEMINRQVELDIQEQRDQRKLAVDEVNALRADYWKGVQNKMDQMKFESGERVKTAQIDNITSQIAERAAKTKAAKKEAIAAHAVEQKLASGNLTTADLRKMPKEERERVVVMPDGTLQQATTKEAATETRKFVSEIKPGLDALSQLRRMATEGSRLNLEDRARVATLRRTLVGQLRLSLVGPGALTEKEIQIIEDTIGNPNKFVFQDLEKAKIQVLMKSMKDRIDAKYQASGVNPPKSKRDKLIERETQKGRSKAQVEKTINKLIESGKLPEDYAI